MTVRRLLIANRGEIAIRIARTAAEMGIESVAIYATDDDSALHRFKAGQSLALPGSGAKAYLDGPAIISLARESGCDLIHPGYGFLSENATFAGQCAAAGLNFIGPPEETLRLFGDKVAARELARSLNVPLLDGSVEPVSSGEAAAFFGSLGSGAAMAIKAVAGGGGRGIRIVTDAAEIGPMFERCRSEAAAAFGDGRLYIERALREARHIEVQTAADLTGSVIHLGERECSLQRRHQKIVEVAPAPSLDPAMRTRLTDAALAMARAARLKGIATFEFLVDVSSPGAFFFMETNPRLQVEHTVTEEVTGVDLVRLQIALATGESFGQLGISPDAGQNPRGYAIQARINLETIAPDGTVEPALGTITRYEPPSGLGVRTDGAGYVGFTPGVAYDSLLAKVIAHVPSGTFTESVTRLERALAEFDVEGIATNIPFLRALLEQPAVRQGTLTTRFIDDHTSDIAARSAAFASRPSPRPAPHESAGRTTALEQEDELVSPVDLGGMLVLRAPVQGTIVSVNVVPGDMVQAGAIVAVIEAMKMEHEVRSPVSGRVVTVLAAAGAIAVKGRPLVDIEATDIDADDLAASIDDDPDRVRSDLESVFVRRTQTLDSARGSQVARRHASGGRTARENVDDLCGASFLEYGRLVVAAQEHRFETAELIERSQADGVVAGIGAVNSELFTAPVSKCVIIAHDGTVFAGTQGRRGMAKIRRMLEVAEQGQLPVVVYAEGGGARSGEHGANEGSTTSLWTLASRLSGLVPLVGVVNGRCFAGNAGLLGVCDVIIATNNSNLGMGGPAMVEGGGLGIVAPEDIGPTSVQFPNGVIDVLVEDEASATAAAKRYLSYFQGATSPWEAADQRLLRSVVPENRVRAYDMRRVIELLADTGSVLELRAGFGAAMLTALIRLEGRPVGVIANNPLVLSGALDADGSDKAARFMQLCDAFDLPIISLCDTPGTMVGPETERTAILRHSSRMFLVGSNLTVPVMNIVLRKRTGLGAAAMQPPSIFNVTWPTGEFARMNIEGSIRLSQKARLAAIEDQATRKKVFDDLVAADYEAWNAMNQAQAFAIDELIDPAETRSWIARTLESVRTTPRTGKKRPYIDAW
ncbi:MAG: carboxyl transferase domain-containing protein [Dehalococcoidia bacterium]|nr:carbamoyl-phosphate synthase large subunit [Dehalococcoidia bacterium]